MIGEKEIRTPQSIARVMASTVITKKRGLFLSLTRSRPHCGQRVRLFSNNSAHSVQRFIALFLRIHKLICLLILTRIDRQNNYMFFFISSFSLFSASRIPPISLIRPSLTASSPSNMVPTSLTSIEVSSISSSRRG